MQEDEQQAQEIMDSSDLIEINPTPQQGTFSGFPDMNLDMGFDFSLD